MPDPEFNPSFRAPAASSEVLVMETVVFRQGPQQLFWKTSCSRSLGTDEQVYSRKATVDGRVPLDVGWVEECALLLVQNVEGTDRQVIPTPEERAAESQKILLVSKLDVAVALVRPGGSCRIEPADLEGWTVRGLGGPTRAVVTLVPSGGK